MYLTVNLWRYSLPVNSKDICFFYYIPCAWSSSVRIVFGVCFTLTSMPHSFFSFLCLFLFQLFYMAMWCDVRCVNNVYSCLNQFFHRKEQRHHQLMTMGLFRTIHADYYIWKYLCVFFCTFSTRICQNAPKTVSQLYCQYKRKLCDR